MEKEIKLENESGVSDSIVLAEPDATNNRIIVLCHGFMSSRESRTNLVLTEKLLSENIATCRFNFYGHGEDGHPFQEMTLTRCLEQVEEVFSWIAKSPYSKVGLMGSSFGGLVAITIAAHHPELMALGLKCPVSDYPPIWQALLGEAGMATWNSDGVLSFATHEGRARLSYAFYEDLLQYETYKDAERIQAPTLIVHGDADTDVSFAQSERLFETLRSKKALERIAGADHRFTKAEDYEQMVDRLFHWFTSKFKEAASDDE